MLAGIHLGGSVIYTKYLTHSLGENVVIEREASAPAFRLLHVKDTGALTLENVTLTNGDGGTTHGGGPAGVGRSINSPTLPSQPWGSVAFRQTAVLPPTMPALAPPE